MNPPKNLVPEYKFNAVLLGLSILLFLSTFPYWFFGEDSQASLINVFLGKNLNTSADPKSLRWGTFVIHAIVTGIGMLVYYKSDVTKWIGRQISIQHPVASFFYKNNRLAKAVTVVFKVIVGFLIVYLLYTLLLELMKTILIPRSDFTFLIILFLIGSAGWFVKYPDPQELVDFAGNVDNRNRTMWIRLRDSQIAYVQSLSNTDEWNLYASKKEVDLSHTEAYVFYERTFSHYLKDYTISEDIIGRLMYSFRIEALLHNFPKKFTLEKLQLLNNRFRSQSDIEKLLFLSIDKGDLLKKARAETFAGLNKYFDVNPNILHNQAEQMNQEFDSIMKGYANYSNIAVDINHEIEKHIIDLFGTSSFFKINFEITKTEFNVNEILKEIIDSRKKMSATIVQGNIDVQTKLFDTAATIAVTPGASATKIDNLLNFAAKLNSSFSNGSGKLPDKKENIKQMLNPLKTASENVINAIFEVMDQNPDPDALTEAVSRSTSYISENQIPVDHFVRRFFQKMADEKVDRSREAYRQLAEDTFIEFTEQK